MLFNAVSYAVFLPIVFALFWIMPKKYRWSVLLVASYYYYISWGLKYCVWIILTTVLSFFCARGIEKFDETKKKKFLLYLPVVFSLGTLVFFKYFNFLSTSLTSLLRLFSLPVDDFTLKLVMPLGISFYSFQTVGYLVDVYKGKITAQTHFGKYALFISFFPHVLSGPIARANDLLPQLECDKNFSFDEASYGMRQFVWGLFKKIVVSDLCAALVDKIYNGLEGRAGFVLVLATVLYAFQIYCDFSGYSDMAIGSAKLFGINLMTNFKNPYTSQSIKEFWGRWHISLSTWFRDYIYIPLGGNRVNFFRYGVNIIITFLVSGLWHGAASTFIIWGLIHGVIQVIETLIYKQKPFLKFAPKKGEKKILCLSGIIKLLLTFAIVCFAWIFFRANSLHDAVYVITNMFKGMGNPLLYIKEGVNCLGLDNEMIIRLFPSLGLLIITDFMFLKNDLFKKIGEINPVFRWIIYIFVLLMIIVLKPSDANANFIYFQF